MTEIIELLGLLIGFGMVATTITIFIVFMRHIKQKEDSMIAFYEEQRGY